MREEERKENSLKEENKKRCESEPSRSQCKKLYVIFYYSKIS